MILKQIDPKFIKENVSDKGYVVIEDAIDPSTFESIRTFWLDYYKKPSNTLSAVTWTPFIGEMNKTSYSSDEFQTLYRSYDFLWNQAFHVDTRNLCVELQRLKNRALNEPEDNGFRFSPDRYGMYVSTSYYPPGIGRLGMHRDSNLNKEVLIHFIVPLTFKDIDYADGGLVIETKNGKRIDVDAQMKPGSVLYYDAGLNHGVDQIVPKFGQSVGRLQTFGITTNFEQPWKSDDLFGRVSMHRMLNFKLLKIKKKLKSSIFFNKLD